MKADDRRDLWGRLAVIEDWLGGLFGPGAASVSAEGWGGAHGNASPPDFEATERAALPARNPSTLAGASEGAETRAKKGVEATQALGAIALDAARCERCRLASSRKSVVFGTGVENPLVLVIGEGPGAEEDASGLPFVGPAGRLLDRMLAAVGLSREENVYIANIVKCRPPMNRDPAPDEQAACLPFLRAQTAALRPKVVLALGRVAAQALTGSKEGITRLRGRWFVVDGLPLIATFHPSAVLRDETLKRPAWEDLKALKAKLAEMYAEPRIFERSSAASCPENLSGRGFDLRSQVTALAGRDTLEVRDAASAGLDESDPVRSSVAGEAEDETPAGLVER